MLYYALTTFLSAFLLFLVQPIIGKFVLPWFGGTPAVWTTCMLFFQVLLLLGYAYAHFLVVRCNPRIQRRIHLVVLLLSLLVVLTLSITWKSPILPGASWKPQNSDHPTWSVIQLLAISIGFPFWILSTTGPLLQGWFSRVHRGVSAYRLYALSNLGSLLALISYPFLVEPMLSLRRQAAVWTSGYLAFAVSCAACAFQTARVAGEGNPLNQSDTSAMEKGESPQQSDWSRPSWKQHLLWVGLAAAASIMLLATTNQICQEVAVIPFLWVLPLCLYLVSFILCFESDRWYSRRIFLPVLFLAVSLAAGVLYEGVDAKILVQVLVYSFALFTCCMVCHGELVTLKPASHYLTSFYLMIASGGAAGGIFTGLVAPRIFKGYWELHFGLWLCCFLAVIILVSDKSSWIYCRHPWPSLFVVFALVILANTLMDEDFSDSLIAALRHALLSRESGIAAVAVATLVAAEQHKRFYLSRPRLAVSGLSLRRAA